MVRLGPKYGPCRPLCSSSSIPTSRQRDGSRLYRAFESEPAALRSCPSTGNGTSAALLPRYSRHRACHDGAIRHPRPCAGRAAAARHVVVRTSFAPTAGAASKIAPPGAADGEASGVQRPCRFLARSSSMPRVLRPAGRHGRSSSRWSVAGHAHRRDAPTLNGAAEDGNLGAVYDGNLAHPAPLSAWQQCRMRRRPHPPPRRSCTRPSSPRPSPSPSSPPPTRPSSCAPRAPAPPPQQS
jgi:hypothetical protein